MNKVKSPLVKVLRKAGYSTKEAIDITLSARMYYNMQDTGSQKLFNQLAYSGDVQSMFVWMDTADGHNHWRRIQEVLNQ